MTSGLVDRAARAGRESSSTWRRSEDARLVSGQAEFVGDFTRDGEVAMRVVRSPLAHGALRKIDTSRAAAMPGVELILTADDLDQNPRIPLRVKNRPELEAYRQPILATDKVRYVGEPVAVVVAATARRAEDAADMIEVYIDSLPAVIDVDQEAETPIWADSPDGCLCAFHGVTGDFETAAATAALVVTRDLETGRDTGLPLETRGLLAEWDNEVLHVWGPTKFVRFSRRCLAEWFGLEESDVVCHHVDVGGMFGTRGELYPEDYLVPFASRILRKPVKWIEDRNEHMVAINHSRGQKHRISVAVDADGRLLGLKDEIRLDLGAYSRPIGGRITEIPVECIPGPYLWPVIDVSCRGVATNKTPTGTMRGPGTFDAGFVRERMMDIVAAQLGLDPIELRRRNLIPAERIPYHQDFGSQMHPSIYDSGDFHAIAEHVYTEVDLASLRSAVSRRRSAGELVGLGVGYFLAHAGLGLEESIRLSVQTDGRVLVETTGSEIGQGLGSMLRIVVSSTLGSDANSVDVVTNSTVNYDGGNGTFSARSTIFSGSAAHDAAKQLLEKFREIQPDADPADVEAWRHLGPISVVGVHKCKDPVFGFGLHVAVVSLDVDTLQPTVERLVVGYDCGKAIDPGSLHGQIVGAAVQGVGGTFLQELLFDPDGVPQCTTFMDYLIPTVHEAPHVEVVLLEYPTSANPLGVKGGGEAGIMGAGGALANAVADALECVDSIRRLPITADAILPHVAAVPGQNGAEEQIAATQVGDIVEPVGRPADVPLLMTMAAGVLSAVGLAAAMVYSHSMKRRHRGS